MLQGVEDAIHESIVIRDSRLPTNTLAYGLYVSPKRPFPNGALLYMVWQTMYVRTARHSPDI